MIYIAFSKLTIRFTASLAEPNNILVGVIHREDQIGVG